MRIQSDRAAGVLLAAACGDALGVPYEFGAPLSRNEQPVMRGGGLGPYAPGEYSDDTQMAMCIAEVSATGTDLRRSDSLDRIAGNFFRWKREGASDIWAQTRTVLDAVSHVSGPGIAAAMRDAAADLHRRTGRSAGNGSLMRTAPVALAYLGDPEALAEAARAVSELTHYGPWPRTRVCCGAPGSAGRCSTGPSTGYARVWTCCPRNAVTDGRAGWPRRSLRAPNSLSVGVGASR